MRFKAEIYEDLKIDAINLLEYCGTDNLPINPFEIAKKLGLSIIPYSFFGEESKLLMKFSSDGFIFRKTIYYNDNCKYNGRINYTIMHEIGHYVLGHKSHGEEEESEANFFAKYILVPPPLVHKMIKNLSLNDIVELFDITYTLADYTIDYYRKWIHYGEIDFTPYEQKLLKLFNIA